MFPKQHVRMKVDSRPNRVLFNDACSIYGWSTNHQPQPTQGLLKIGFP